MDISTLSFDDLKALAAEKRDEIAAIFAVETPSKQQVEEAQALAADIKTIEAAIDAAQADAEADAEALDAFAALKAEFSSEDEVEEAAEEEPEVEDEPEVEAAAEVEPEVEVEQEAVVAAARPRRSARAVVSKKPRPEAPETVKASPISITAAADVPEFATGQKLAGVEDIAKAAMNRAGAFPKFRPGQGGEPVLHKFGVASLRLDFPEDLTVKRGTDDLTVIEHARKESRLEGGNLVAAGGWCAPSETIYDLCEGESLDGILSLPEINVARGGINYTSGPSFADFYGNSFKQTEAQAISGTEKDCFEVECPEFDEIRLDAVGLCLTVPILTESAYPELVKRFISGSIVAHQHWVNNDVITRMVALSGAARVITGLGSTVSDSLEGLELLAEQRRQAYRLPLDATLEVVVPFWVRAAFRSDIARRNGIAKEVVTDADIDAHFRARKLNVQFVYDWQGLDEDAEVFPASYDALMYPAGTFIKGVHDVINISAVYDSEALKVNTYTGLFMEQGILVAKTCYDSDLVRLPICNSGAQGALDITCGGSI